MDPVSKRETALKLLAATGIWRSNYAPPITRLMWRFGFNVPPPHFARFGSVALIAGVYFAVAWGLLMWLVTWSQQQQSMYISVVSACAAGLFFGLAMAGYYAYGRRKYKLPSWDSLESGHARI